MKHPIITSLGLAVLAGVALVTTAGNAQASLTVTNYGEAAILPTGMSFDKYPMGIYGNWSLVNLAFNEITQKNRLVMKAAGQITFTRGTDLTDDILADAAYYFVKDATEGWPLPNGLKQGAQVGDVNFANFDFEGDGKFEMVGQFHFDNTGGGYLIAVAKNTSGDPLSISAGKLLIEQGPGTYELASVPELTSSFTLLGLISSGLLLRRRTQRIH